MKNSYSLTCPVIFIQLIIGLTLSAGYLSSEQIMPLFKHDEIALEYQFDEFINSLNCLKISEDYSGAIRKLLSDNPESQKEAVATLVATGEIEVIPWLLPLLDSDNKDLSIRTGASLEKLVSSYVLKRRDMNISHEVVIKPLGPGDKDLRPLAWIVLKMFRKPDDGNTHAYAASMTKYLGLYEFEAELKECLNSIHPAVKNRAGEAIASLELHRSFGLHRIEKFIDSIQSLDKTQPESITAVMDIYKTLFSDDAFGAEEGFRLFRKFYKEVIRACDRNFFKKNSLQEVLDKIAAVVKNEQKNTDFSDTVLWANFQSCISPEAGTLQQKFSEEMEELAVYAKNGIVFESSEGYWYLAENNEFLLNEVLKGYSFNLKKYVAFLIDENNKHPEILEDAGLRISWDELRERIIRWELFSKKYPDMKETNEEVISAIGGIKWMLSAYLGGFIFDNTPIYIRSTRRIRNDVKISYERFLKENEDSTYWPLVKKVYDMYKGNDFMFMEETEAEIKSSIVKEE